MTKNSDQKTVLQIIFNLPFIYSDENSLVNNQQLVRFEAKDIEKLLLQEDLTFDHFQVTGIKSIDLKAAQLIILEIHDTYEQALNLLDNYLRVELTSKASYFNQVCKFFKETVGKHAKTSKKIPGFQKEFAAQGFFHLGSLMVELQRLYSQGWGVHVCFQHANLRIRTLGQNFNKYANQGTIFRTGASKQLLTQMNPGLTKKIFYLVYQLPYVKLRGMVHKITANLLNRACFDATCDMVPPTVMSIIYACKLTSCRGSYLAPLEL